MLNRKHFITCMALTNGFQRNWGHYIQEMQFKSYLTNFTPAWRMWKNLTGQLWDHNHCKRLLSCWGKVLYHFIESLDNLHRMGMNWQYKVFMRRQRMPGCFFSIIFLTGMKWPLSALCCCFRCFSLGHNSVLKTIRQPNFMALMGSHIVHARSPNKTWSHYSSLWFRCWRKIAVVYHLRHQVREKEKVLSVTLFYSGLEKHLVGTFQLWKSRKRFSHLTAEN